MICNREEKDDARAAAAVAPKRVVDGFVLKAKARKKKKNKKSMQPNLTSSIGGHHHQSSSSCVPSILRSIPTNKEDEQCGHQAPLKHNEFDDDTLFDDEIDVPSDALMCLQTYTSSRSGSMSETCAYCPIFTQEGAVGADSNDHGSKDDNGNGSSKSTHAAPFLTKCILLHLLHDSANASSGVSSRTHVELEIKQLAKSNKIRMLQLHGTAISSSGGGSIGCRGDGNDDEDVAIMETNAYTAAVEMALQNYFQSQSSTIQHTNKVGIVSSWYTFVLLPYFAGKTWFSSDALDSFLDDTLSITKEMHTTLKSNQGVSGKHLFSISQMKEMIQQLVHAGLLLPRRGVGPSGGEGYWFSLPGLGRAAKSIVDGRNNLLRRLQSSRYKEKKRSVLEQEIGRVKHHGKEKVKLEQSGKFVVLDLLSKEWVQIHKTSAGDQFVRLA